MGGNSHTFPLLLLLVELIETVVLVAEVELVLVVAASDIIAASDVKFPAGGSSGDIKSPGLYSGSKECRARSTSQIWLIIERCCSCTSRNCVESGSIMPIEFANNAITIGKTMSALILYL